MVGVRSAHFDDENRSDTPLAVVEVFIRGVGAIFKKLKENFLILQSSTQNSALTNY